MTQWVVYLLARRRTKGPLSLKCRAIEYFSSVVFLFFFLYSFSRFYYLAERRLVEFNSSSISTRWSLEKVATRSCLIFKILSVSFHRPFIQSSSRRWRSLTQWKKIEQFQKWCIFLIRSLIRVSRWLAYLGHPASRLPGVIKGVDDQDRLLGGLIWRPSHQRMMPG